MNKKTVITALRAAADALDPIHCIVGGAVADAQDFGGVSEDDARKALLYGPDTFLYAGPGDRVLCHLNLGHKHKVHGLKTWSVKEPKGRQSVIGHVFGMVLKDARFTVRAGGNKVVLETGEKTVHAWVDGKIVASSPPDSVSVSHGEAVEIRYNPHAGMTWFMRQDDGGGWTIPVASAERVYLTETWKVFAKGHVDKVDTAVSAARRSTQAEDDLLDELWAWYEVAQKATLQVDDEELTPQTDAILHRFVVDLEARSKDAWRSADDLFSQLDSMGVEITPPPRPKKKGRR